MQCEQPAAAYVLMLVLQQLCMPTCEHIRSESEIKDEMATENVEENSIDSITDDDSPTDITQG